MKIRIIFIWMSAIMTIAACKDKKPELPAIDPAFTNYIQAFTAGVVSNQSNIRIRLTEVNLKANKGDEIDASIFDFSPSIEGKAIWVDQQTIEFVPEEKLPSGVIFHVAFELGKIQKVPEELEKFEFRFQVIKQQLMVNFEGMKAYDDKDLGWQQLNLQVKTTDYADLEGIKNAIQATQNGKILNLNWEFNQDNLTHQFYVDSVKRKETAGSVLISWEGEEIDAETSGSEEIIIPALGDFKVMTVYVEQLPNQKITVNFSDPIKSDLNINGLIYTKEGDEFTTSSGRNSISLYPKKIMNGRRSLVVTKAIKNTLGYALQNEHLENITFTSMKPEVAFIGKGNILPSADGFKLPIKAVNLSGVNVKVIKIFENNIPQFFQSNQFDGRNSLKQVGRIVLKKSVSLIGDQSANLSDWNTYQLNLTELVEVEPGAIYRVTIGFDRSQSLYPCENDEKFEQIEYKINEGDKSWNDLPNGYYYDYYDDYYYEDYYHDEDENSRNNRSNPCKAAYYGSRHEQTTNVLASDLGIIAKSGDNNKLKVVVTDLKTTTSKGGVLLKIYNYQQQVIAETRTDENGMATIPLKGKPFLIAAEHKEERGYLKIDDGSALSLSMFDISGEENTKGLKGFIYGERGVWRPGDSLFLNFILEDKNLQLPKNHPVVLELYTPENQLYLKKVKNAGVNNFYHFNLKTAASAPTGNWQVKVKVGHASFYKRIKIEAIKPNRLKLNVEFENKILTKGETGGTLTAKWLHGADAGNLRAVIEMNLSGGNTTFSGYNDYIFDDPIRKTTIEEKVVFDGQLNENGQIDFNPSIVVENQAPGMLTAFFKTRVFEKGGDFSIDRFKTTYSPYESYVGIKIPKGDGWNDAIYSNETNLFPIATLDENGQPVDRENVKIEIFDIYWRWWWESNNGDDLARYVNNRSSYLIKSETISTKDGKALYALKFKDNRYGRKLIRVTDPVSGHVSGAIVYMTYRGWWNDSNGNNPGGAEMLNFTTDKKKYTVGEEIHFKLPKMKQGRVLVSIESGSRILETFWKDASEIKDGIKIKTSEDMAPNVYAHLTLIQPHANTKNDLPIRMYGVQNIHVESPNTHLYPQIKMAKTLRPESKFEVEVSEKNGKEMTYTIAIVDEGLLDLTRFSTPSPWNHFYKKEALGVKTWDLYKYVMGAFAGEISGLLAIGGDDNLNAGEGNKANRFKPVVMFKGPFKLYANEKVRHSFTMPNYIGSVRTMVVAGDYAAYGSTEQATTVKKPLMVLASLPRVVSPSEKLKLPVTIFAMEERIKKVKVSVVSNNNFIIKEKERIVEFDKVGDKVIYFDLEVKEKIGKGKVKVVVESAGEIASNEIELAIRLPNPEIDKTISALVEPGKTWSLNYSPIGIEGTNEGSIEVSSIPSLNLEKRLNYLIRYPHGCIEQTTSAAFPQLYLNDLLSLESSQKSTIQKHISESLNNLRLFQLSSGGFSYWPGQLEVSDWGTNYVGHFMIEAKNKGYVLPTGMLEDWISYQTKTANFWEMPRNTYESKYYREGEELNQAYRLYTLALAGKPAIGAMNRLREQRSLYELSKWRLAATYALINKKQTALDIIKKLNTQLPTYTYSRTYGSTTRDEAMILESLDLLNLKTEAKQVMDRIAESLRSDRWLSTQTTAYSLLAISKFVKGVGEDRSMKYVLKNAGKSKTIDSEKNIEKSELMMKDESVSVTNNSQKTLFIQMNLSGVPLNGVKVDQFNRLNMQVRYLNMEGEEISISTLAQGTDFMAEVTIIHPGGVNRDYKEMALSQLFPSGWEIRNLRLDESSSKYSRDKPEYEDIRDDRVYTYFDLPKGQNKTFRILLNAAYLGEFYLPAIECSAMYDNSIQAVVSGKWIKVVEPGK